MPKYRHGWQDKTTGLNYRLEILTYDHNYDVAPTALTGLEIVSIGELVREMDELPVGVMKPPTLTVTMDFSACSSALQTYLRNAESGTLRNTWIFSVSYDAGSTYEIEFAGVQSRTESSQYTLTPSGQMLVEYELEDLLWSLLSVYGGKDLCDIIDGNTELPFQDGLFDVDIYSPTDVPDSLFFLKRADLKVRPAKLYKLIDKYFAFLEDVYISTNLHYAGGNIALVSATDPLGRPGQDILKWGMIFYEQGSAGSTGALPRDQGPQISELDILVPAEVWDEEGMIGGYCSPNDEIGVAQYQSGADWLKDLCETFAVKMRWRYEVGTTGGGLDYIRVIPKVGAIFEALEVSPVTITVDTDVLKGDITIEEGAAVISKAEVEWTGGDEDMGNIVVTQPGTRSQRTFTVRASVHNLPTVKDSIRNTSTGKKVAASGSGWSFGTLGLTQTNVLSYITDVNTYAKVHEAISVQDGSGSTLYYNTISEYPDDRSLEKFALWCLDVQTLTGLPFALASHYSSKFGDRNQALVTLTMPMKSIEGTGYDVATKVSVSGLTGLTHLTTNNGQIVSHRRNYDDGTMTLGILLCPP